MPTPPASARPASRSPARSPAAAANAPANAPANAAKSQRRTRRTSKELMLAKVDELRTMIEDHCDAGAPKTPGAAKPKSQTRKANAIPRLVPGTLATPAALAASKPSTMVPLSLPAAASAPTPSIASAAAASSAAAPSKRTGVPRPMQSRTHKGSYQWFIDDWVKKNPELAAGKTRPQLMALAEMKRNYKIYKNSKGSAGAAALSAVAEEENLGLL